MSDSRAPTRLDLLRRLLKYTRKYWKWLAFSMLCSSGIAGLTSTYAWLVKPFLDGIFVEKNHVLLMLLPAALLGVTILKGLLGYALSYAMSCVSNRMVSDIQQELFIHLTLLPIRFHDRHSSGRLVSRVLNDVGTMGSAIPEMMKRVVQQALTFVAMMGVAFYQNWQLASLLLILGPVAAAASLRVGNRMVPLATRSQQLAEDTTSLLEEAFSAIRIVKAYGNERREHARFRDNQDLVVQTRIKFALVASLTSPIIEFIGVIGIGAIIWYGGYQVINGTMTPGEFFSFLMALALAYRPVRAMGGVNTVIQSAIAAAVRVFELLDQENETAMDHGTFQLPPLSRSLEFRHVEFRYEGRKESALTGIDLTIQVGEVIALVGRSGAGKSTLAHLVIRFYDPTSGTILMDGRDLREATLESLRGQIGVVTQEPILFDDTVYNNISYGRTDASHADVVAAAKAAAADEFIQRLPDGYESLIGEKGVKLSGGQRQRIAIARAILRDPPLLILDEATSSLDSESERLVQGALCNLMKRRTALVIAHRLSTVLNAHRIVVLDRGHIVGSGTHEQLLSTSEVYQQLYRAQFQDLVAQSEPCSVPSPLSVQWTPE